MKRILSFKQMRVVSWMFTALMMLTALTVQAAEYGIKFDGQPVTDDNKDDLTLLPAFTGGEASYDSSTKTLFLTDVMIDVSGNIPALEVTQDELTIKVKGSCYINTMSGYGLHITGTNSQVTLTGRGTLSISATTAVFIGKEYYTPQTTKLTVNGPTLVASGNSATMDDGYGIRGVETLDAYYGELELINGIIQATGSMYSGTYYMGSIVKLGALTVGENATLLQPSNAKIDAHGVSANPWEGKDIYETVLIEALRPDKETPLTIEAKEAATVSIKNPKVLTIGYSIDGDDIVWSADAAISVNLKAGNQLELFGNNQAYGNPTQEQSTSIDFTADCYVYGNVMSLIQDEGFETLTKLESYHSFAYLFVNNTHLYCHSKKQLLLPALKLINACYSDMFSGCSNMTRAPELPATQIAALCYTRMFKSCTSLAEAPALPAPILANYCYQSMFSGCTSLTAAPELAAETLIESCYRSMFNGCSNLNTVTCWALDISANNCTEDWLRNVSSNGTFNCAKITAWELFSPSGVPDGWTKKVDYTMDVCGLAFTPTELTVNSEEEYTKPVLTNPHELPVTYSSSDPTVATVDAELGTLTILKPGTTTVTATFAGSSSYYPGHASYTLTVVSKGDEPVFAFARGGVVLASGESVPDIELTMSDGLTAIYASDNTSVVTVSATTGKVTPRGTGVCTITATTEGDLQYKGATAKYYIMVVPDGERVRHDSNNDGKVTITDAVSVVDYILSGKE